MNRITLKDHIQETKLFWNRTIWVVFGLALLLMVTLSRLIYLQVLKHEHYQTKSHDNRVKVSAVAPARGLIYDRNGVVLADNLTAYHLEIVPEQVGDMEALLDQLAELVELRDIDLKRFAKQRRQQAAFHSVPLRFNLNDMEVARIAAINHRLPGVHIVARLSRNYPLGHLLSHVIGYVGRIDERDLERIDKTNYRGTNHIGKIGIERRYESVLHGTVGYEKAETNVRGRVVRTLEEGSNDPVAGKDLHLTLDLPMQVMAHYALGERNGAVVAMDPNNGHILTLVSKPGYDPNAFVDGIKLADYQALRNDDNRPLYNRALLGQYPPGSTIKPFLGLAGLYYGMSNEQRRISCRGFYILPGRRRPFRDWKRSGHGVVDLDNAIAQSCDVYFYQLARTMGIERMAEFLKHFGFGEPTGIDLYGERAGLLPTPEWKQRVRKQPWFPGETINAGIGQGYMLATPLQLAVATATLATHGKRVQPRLVNPATVAASRVEPEITQTLLGVRDDHWKYITAAMEHVVHGPRGTARKVASPDYKTAGKTGTAQVFSLKADQKYNAKELDIKLRDHALFIAFAPVQNPRIAVSVFVENGGGGSRTAAPIAKLLLQHFMALNPS